MQGMITHLRLLTHPNLSWFISAHTFILRNNFPVQVLSINSGKPWPGQSMTTRVIGWLIKNNLFRFDDHNYLYELWYRTVVLYIFSSIYDIQNSASSSHISVSCKLRYGICRYHKDICCIKWLCIILTWYICLNKKRYLNVLSPDAKIGVRGVFDFNEKNKVNNDEVTS